MKTFILVTVLGVCLLFAGCIVTGNVVIIEEINDFIVNENDSLSTQYVDLTDNPDWNDHKDQLNGIDDVGFACTITNNRPETATGELYVDSSLKFLETPSAVRMNALLILSGIVVTGNSTRTIEWEESYDFLDHIEELKTIVLGEKFYAYFITKEENTNVAVRKVLVFLSVNAKP